ncbi:methyltransferase [Escherichia phage 4MG]|uniref:Hyphothetical protein n=1 Tax=Escherichia phage 4MG TaxID=1391428 RepID=V5KSG9_9CAUD|nr:methyltransferase [Escherichia phage 4MG]AGZ17739.1 hyphothetical protein [Escherichia phage 4MG]
MTMSKSLGQTTPAQPTEIGGKRFAGILRDVEPFFGFGTHKEVRCIYGILGRDHKNRGFDGGPVRTSVVQDLIVHEGDIYAITMNSAYLLESVQLQHFIASDIWRDDIAKLIALAMIGQAAKNEESKID